jgi:hypothetical protein
VFVGALAGAGSVLLSIIDYIINMNPAWLKFIFKIIIFFAFIDVGVWVLLKLERMPQKKAEPGGQN